MAVTTAPPPMVGLLAGTVIASPRLFLCTTRLHPRPFARSFTSTARLSVHCRPLVTGPCRCSPAPTLTRPPLRFPHRQFSTSSMPVAQDFEAVLKGKYPAKAHVKRVVELIRQKIPDADGILYLEGRMTKLLEDNDSPEPFRQRRYFYYLTGCNLADAHFIYDLKASKSILFIPPIDPEDVIWSGLPMSPEEALQQYDVDEVKTSDEVNPILAHLGGQNPKSTVFAIAHQVSDHVTFIGFEDKEFTVLKDAIEVSRAIKDEFEVAMIRKANQISGMGHQAVFEKARKAKNETELEAKFLEVCVSHGAKEMAYHPIVASGRAAATLHYVPNNAPLEGKQNLLLDAGAEWNNYAADITRTFPISGKFTKESREIYDIVLKMQEETTAMVKEGVNWDDVHLLAHKIAIDGLLALGILKGDKDEILNNRTSTAFFPHGLGHYLGMDTHDTGGNPNYNDEDKMFRYLRKRGALPAGAVITVEPGIYFCNFIIEPFLNDPKHSKYIDAAVLDKYWDVGGVRVRGSSPSFDVIKRRPLFLVAGAGAETNGGFYDLTHSTTAQKTYEDARRSNPALCYRRRALPAEHQQQQQQQQQHYVELEASSPITPAPGSATSPTPNPPPKLRPVRSAIDLSPTNPAAVQFPLYDTVTNLPVRAYSDLEVRVESPQTTLGPNSLASTVLSSNASTLLDTTKRSPLRRAKSSSALAVKKDSKMKNALNEAQYLATGVVKHARESTKHYTIIRHCHGLIWYKGPTTSVPISILSDAPLPEDRTLWLQAKGFTGKMGMSIKALVGTKGIDVTPALKATVDDIPPTEERMMKRDLKRFKKKATGVNVWHTPRESHIVRIPAAAKDGYFRIVLCSNNGRKILCGSPIFRIASTSTDAAVVRGASLKSMPLELGVKAATTVGQRVARTYAGVAGAVVESRAKKVVPVAAIRRAGSTAFTGYQMTGFDEQWKKSQEGRYDPMAMGVEGGIETELSIIGSDAGPEEPFPLVFDGKVMKGSGRPSSNLGYPMAELQGVPDAITMRLSGVFAAWARIAKEEDWQETLVTIAPPRHAPPGVIMRNGVTVHLITDFDDLDSEPPTPSTPSAPSLSSIFSDAKLKILLMGYLHPAMPGGAATPPDAYLAEHARDVLTTVASLGRAPWSAEEALARIAARRSDMTAVDKLGEATGKVAEQVEKIPIHYVGVRSEAQELRDQVYGKGGIWIARS
ncbi:hypothetical protein S40293_07372 [Stachybotrys chartarum IBT 40293]|nr:hypothetical protein S40293_07372 [Stachybotrys chartarum IBT 40293]